MDTFILIHTPNGRAFQIDGSERECADTLRALADSFERRGGAWLVWGEEGTSWVPSTSDIEFNLDVTVVADDFSVIAPATIEVIHPR